MLMLMLIRGEPNWASSPNNSNRPGHGPPITSHNPLDRLAVNTNTPRRSISGPFHMSAVCCLHATLPLQLARLHVPRICDMPICDMRLGMCAVRVPGELKRTNEQ